MLRDFWVLQTVIVRVISCRKSPRGLSGVRNLISFVDKSLLKAILSTKKVNPCVMLIDKGRGN